MVLGPVVAVATHELGHRLVRSVASLASGILVSALQREGMHLGWQARIGKARRRVTVFAVGTIVIGIWRLVTVCALCARCQLEVEVWVAVDALCLGMGANQLQRVAVHGYLMPNVG
jgi:hypothetical protein